MNKTLEKISTRIPGFKYLVAAIAFCTLFWGVLLFKTYREVVAIRKAAILELEQSKAEAEEHLKRERLAASDSLKFDRSTHMEMALNYFRQKRYDESIPHFKRSLYLTDYKYITDNAYAYFALADAYIKSRRPKEALLWVKELKLVLGELPGLKVREAEAFFISGEIDRAKSLLDAVVSIDTTNSIAYRLLAQIAIAKSLPEKEIRFLFDKSIELDNRAVESYYQFGVYLEKSGYYNEAVEALKMVLKLEPFHTPSLGRIGMIHYYRGDYKAAKEAYELALSINRTDYNTSYNLGELLLTAYKDMEGAYKWFLRTVEIKKGHFAALKKLGIIAMNNRNYKEAAYYFGEAEKSRGSQNTDESLARLFILAATAHEYLGNHDIAKEYFKKTLRIDPLNRVARHKLSML